MSSYAHHHLHELDNASDLRLSRRAAERFTVLEALREQRRDDRARQRRSVTEPLRGLFTARRARRGTSPA